MCVARLRIDSEFRQKVPRRAWHGAGQETGVQKRRSQTVVDATRTDLFGLADQRLKYLDKRASLLAENIANADTPGWKGRDLLPFAQALQTASVTPERTNPMHLTGTSTATAGAREEGGERAPDGNTVKLDAELAKLADTETAQTLVTDLYSKYLGLFRTALGR